MKIKNLFIIISCSLLFILLTSETLDSSGKLISAGGPGEGTCSTTGCHGAGNGNGTSGGLADNAGPGNITLVSVPALTANKYVPGTTYNMTITVSETGKNLFGFSFEALDNSGNTSITVNNATGSITVTDAVRTRTGQPFSTGRLTLTHKTNGGAVANAANFTFSWKAPASGTVNIYYDGAAVNSNTLADAGDNVYSKSMQLTPNTATVTAIGLNDNIENSLVLFPNPAKDHFTLNFNEEDLPFVDVQIMSVDGKIIKHYNKAAGDGKRFSNRYDVDDLARGSYIVKINTGKKTVLKKLIIN
ncbi:MAG: T9SS type A sorting domain-containing protein [Bacteroidetes bacterium]|nr:T9SS type A sorting domain-containing protein [Bacteroidota bacterium]